MRILRICTVIFICIGLLAFMGSEEDSFNDRVIREMTLQTDSLLSSVVVLSKKCNEKQIDTLSAQLALNDCRILAYFFPGEAFRLNKAVVPSIEEDDEVSPEVPFSGFQYVESILYSDSLGFQRKELKAAIDQIYFLISNLPISYSQFFFEERSVWHSRINKCCLF